jgi:hypothetical protein
LDHAGRRNLENIERAVRAWNDNRVILIEAVHDVRRLLTDENVHEGMSLIPPEFLAWITETIALSPETEKEWDELKLVMIGSPDPIGPLPPRSPSPEERQELLRQAELLRRYFAEKGVDLSVVKAELLGRPRIKA